MDEIQAWLHTHGEELSEIGRHTEVTPGMIHLLAVLVLGGVADDLIVAEVRAHLTGESGPAVLAGVPRAVSEIRGLAEPAAPA